MYSVKSKNQHISLLLPSYSSLKVYGKVKISGVFNSDFELKVQKHDSHFAFSRTILSILTVPLKIVGKVKKSVYLILIPLILLSEGV